jgi:hypothetical protein
MGTARQQAKVSGEGSDKTEADEALCLGNSQNKANEQ